MRPSTAAYLAVFVLAAACLTLLIQRESVPATEDGRRVYRFACWGADKEVRELEGLIETINARASDFRVRLVPIPSDYYTKLCTMIAGGTGPDFFYLSQEYAAAFASQGALLDLTDLVERD
ncbi:MAG: extracellular solute-binding protein, partial [Planctomycetota bacterium]